MKTRFMKKSKNPCKISQKHPRLDVLVKKLTKKLITEVMEKVSCLTPMCVCACMNMWVCWQRWTDVWGVQLTGDSRCRSSQEKVFMDPFVSVKFYTEPTHFDTLLCDGSPTEGDLHKSLQSAGCRPQHIYHTWQRSMLSSSFSSLTTGQVIPIMKAIFQSHLLLCTLHLSIIIVKQNALG